ncbi:MAG: type II toxin-antitoxin system VapC family toxin [Pseudomonadota bacterium]
MSRYLLDTNILSDLVRNPSGAIANRIAAVGERNICTSVIVAAELRFGAYRSASRTLSRRVEDLLSVIDILPLEEPADRAYASLRAHLADRGQPIGPNDMLIAAQTLALDFTVVTANEKEFLRVPGLRVENWLRAA